MSLATWSWNDLVATFFSPMVKLKNDLVDSPMRLRIAVSHIYTGAYEYICYVSLTYRTKNQ